MRKEDELIQAGGSAPPERKSRRKKLISGIILLIVIAILVIFSLYKLGYLGGQENEIVIGAGLQEGALDRSKETDSETEKGGNGKSDMTVRINGYPVFEDGESTGNLNIENPAANVLYMEVEITLDDTGEVIYQSGAIPPNHYIDNDKLAKSLEKGEYAATAHVSLIDPDDMDMVYNSANFNLVITIKN